MTDTVIRAENVSKRYTLGGPGEGARYQTLRDRLAGAFKAPWRRVRPASGKNPAATPAANDFWALRDVSFSVRSGEVVGIIGRNGAGKSTLLKVLSRITEPTAGRITLKGRVASLLEVGTGFHPELTGRENIYLNGAILGMHRSEIKAKFDEIVAFAEVERFLDTPVKRYSSGMYVRLAFAVAAHLEPEILVVDEVLAVGDAQFQKKCLGKMQDVSRRDGRTVLFVSHQMSAVENLCSRVIVLGSGSVLFDGTTASGVRFYLNELERRVSSVDLRALRRRGSGEVKLTGFALQDEMGRPLAAVASGDTARLVLDFECRPEARVNQLHAGVSVHNQLGDILSIFYSDFGGEPFGNVPGRGSLVCTIPDLPFSPGRYYIGARILVNGTEADWPQDFIGVIDVDAGNFYGVGAFSQHGLGPVLLRGSWQLRGERSNHSSLAEA